MPLPQQPYDPVHYSDRVRVTNPVGSWANIHPTTQKYLVENYGVDPKGTNWADQPQRLRDAIQRYPLAAVKNMKLNVPKVGDPNYAPAAAPITPRTAAASNIASFAGSMLGSGAGGMAGLPLTGMSGATIKPIPGGGTVNLNKGTVTRNAPMAKQGMDEKQMFKAAFIAKCIEDGLNFEQMSERVKAALDKAQNKSGTEKSANWLTDWASGAGSALGTTASTALALGMLGLGGAAGGGFLLGRKAIGPGIYDAAKPKIPTKEEMLHDELRAEYERQAEELKRSAQYAKNLKERSRNISGVTRY